MPVTKDDDRTTAQLTHLLQERRGEGWNADITAYLSPHAGALNIAMGMFQTQNVGVIIS